MSTLNQGEVTKQRIIPDVPAIQKALDDLDMATLVQPKEARNNKRHSNITIASPTTAFRPISQSFESESSFEQHNALGHFSASLHLHSNASLRRNSYHNVSEENLESDNYSVSHDNIQQRQQSKLVILAKWASEQVENQDKALDWNKEHTLITLTTQLRNSMSRNFYPDMSKVVRVFWAYLCGYEYIEAIMNIFSAPDCKVLVSQLAFEEWEAAIVCAAMTASKGVSENEDLPAKATATERSSESLLQYLAKATPTTFKEDVWERGAVLAAQNGCARVLRIFFKTGKIRVRGAYLLREAADNGHWEIVTYIMSLAGMDQQQHLVKMYRSLYMLQEGTPQVVDQVLASWRSATDTSSFPENWRIAAEMSADKGRMDLLEKMFEIRKPEEQAELVVTLKMLALSFKSFNDKVIEKLLDMSPQSDTEKAGLLHNLSSQHVERLQQLLIRFCSTNNAIILSELQTTSSTPSTLHECHTLVANVVNYVLSYNQVDTESIEIKTLLKNSFIKGNVALGEVLMQNNFQFDWIESSDTQSPRGLTIPLSDASDHNTSKESTLSAFEDSQYNTIISAFGVVGENLMSYNDFEAIVSAASEYHEEPSVKSSFGDLLNFKPQKFLKSSNKASSTTPHILVDTADKVWTSFLAGGDVKKNEGATAGWMEPEYASPVHSGIAGTSEWDSKNHVKTDENALFRGLGGGFTDDKVV